MKQYTSTLLKVARALTLVLAITACETPEETTAPSDGGGGGTTTPVVGMDCGSSSPGYGNINASTNTSKAFFVEDVPGTAITSIKLYLRETTCGNGTTCVTPLTLKVYTCGSAGSLGTLVDTVSLSAGITKGVQEFTFTFSSPITIPTCSNAGEKGFVFQFTNNWSNNVQADINNSSPSTCYLDKGNSLTAAESFGVSNGGVAQYYRAVITATP
jgi:hypothetical protein